MVVDMTEEEIRPIAEKYVEEFCHSSNFEYTDADLICAGIGTALIVAKEKDKKIEELQEVRAGQAKLLNQDTERIMELVAQIEKMKCCANCKYFEGYANVCKGWGEAVTDLNCDCTEWQLKE